MMTINESAGQAYMDAINSQYKGVMLSVDKQTELAKRAKNAGVPEPIIDSWIESRPSFDVNNLDPRYFTEESGARSAGLLEQFKTFGMTDAERDTLREKGISFPQPKELISQIAGDAALAAGQAASMLNPVTAEMTLSEVAPSIANQALKVAFGSTAKQAIGAALGTDNFNARKIASDVFDASALGLLPSFTTPGLSGKYVRTIGNAVTSGIYGLSEANVASQIRGDKLDAQNAILISGLSALGGAAGAYGNKAKDEARIMSNNAKILADAGIEAPPLGIIDPNYSTKLNAVTQANPNVRSEVERIAETLRNNIVDKVGGFGELSEPSVLTQKVSALTQEVPSLTSQAEQAAKATSVAERAYELAKGERSKQFGVALKKTANAAKTKYDEAVASVQAQANAAIDGFLGAFTTQKFNEATNGVAPSLTAAEARKNVKTIARASYDTFKSVASSMFNAVPEGNFNSSSIVDSVNNAIDAAPVEVRGIVRSALKNIPQEVDDAGNITYSNATKQQWLNARNVLNDAIGASARAPSPADHWLNQASRAITEQMDAQKVKALGQEGADKWTKAREFYRSIEAYHDTDVRNLLFGSNENSPLAKTLIADIAENGIGPQSRYGKLVNALKTHGNDQLFKQHEALLNDTIKRYIFDVSTTPDGNLSPQLFVKTIGNMRRRPDALAKIGFGSSQTFSQLETALQQFPEASKLTPQQVETLMSLPGGDRTVGQFKAYQKIIQDLAVQHADAKISKAVAYEAMGNIPAARKMTFEARQAVRAARLSEAKINDALAAAKADPVFGSFGNVNVNPDSYDSLYQTFFNPTGNVSNKDISVMLSSLRKGTKEQRQLADALSARFLNDGMMKAKAVTRTNEEAIGLFSEALTPNKDPGSFYQRALAIFDPDTIAAISKEYRAAKVIEAYRKNVGTQGREIVNAASVAGPVIGTAAQIAPTGGSLTGLFRGIAGLIADGKYHLVNIAYTSNPQGFIKSKDAVASVNKFLGNLNAAQKYQFYVQNKEAAEALNQNQ